MGHLAPVGRSAPNVRAAPSPPHQGEGASARRGDRLAGLAGSGAPNVGPSVIHEVDESIRNLLRQNMPPGTDVEVAFDAPTKEWASRRNAPTIDVYLYDIREDLRRREIGRFDQRAPDGRVTER